MLNMKAVFEALLPPGSLWQPAPSEGFDQFLDVLGENADNIHDRVYDLGSLRDPRKTPILTDLEKEYGVFSDSRLTEAVRRQQLAAIKYAKPGTASDSDLQTILRNAGFDVYVRRNHPPIDPSDLLQDQYLLEAGEIDAFAGEPNAIAGLGGGELLVNGPIVLTSIEYDMQADGVIAFAGEPEAVAGYFEGTTQDLVTYEIPAAPERWPYIFFITGQEWGWLNDWNFNYATVGQWASTDLMIPTKNTDVSFLNSGIRSLKLEWQDQVTDPASGVDFVEQLLDMPILQDADVSGYYWGGGAINMVATIDYLDPVTGLWIAPAAQSTSSISKQSFSFNCPNGIAGIRLGMNGTIVPPAKSTVYFDDILIETNNIARAEVLSEREAEFKRLILKYKPLDTWAGLLVDYV